MSNRPIRVRLARLFQRTHPSDATRVESAVGPRPCREHDDTTAQAIETEAQRYLKTTDAAKYLELSPRTLEGMRVRGDGPPVLQTRPRERGARGVGQQLSFQLQVRIRPLTRCSARRVHDGGKRVALYADHAIALSATR